jgi:flavin-binding protein dodecin
VGIAKINELIGSSALGFEDAARTVIERANRTLRGIKGIEVIEKQVEVGDEGLKEYRVRLRLLFDMAPDTLLHW